MNGKRPTSGERRAAIAVWAAFLMVLVVGMVAFGVDVGYMTLTRAQLQNAADASAMAAAAVMAEPDAVVHSTAQEYAGYQVAAGNNVLLSNDDVEFGVWNVDSRQFTPTGTRGNAIRVTAYRQNAGLFFGGILGRQTFTASA
mgnify:CR=1 FL=1